MTTKQFFLLLIASTTLFACNKSSSSNAIDVGGIYWIDASGIPLGTGIYPNSGGLVHGQWVSDTLTSSQLALFQSLDTAILPNTIIPDSVLIKDSHLLYPVNFPSPSKGSVMIFTGLGGRSVPFPWSSPIMFKYVIVDSLLEPMEKDAKLLYENQVSIVPNIPVGRYRIYLTLSTLNKPNFYQSWGNIQKIP